MIIKRMTMVFDTDKFFFKELTLKKEKRINITFLPFFLNLLI